MDTKLEAINQQNQRTLLRLHCEKEKRHALLLCNTWDPKLIQVLNPGSLSNFYVQLSLRSLHACCCSGVNIGY